MFYYRIAGPHDVREIAKFMSMQSPEDLQMYFGHSISPAAVEQLYVKTEKNLDKQAYVIVKDMYAGLIGFIHLAQAGKDKIELGIFVDSAHRMKGIGKTLMAMSLIYTFTIMNRSLMMQCVNRNFDIRRLITEYERTVEVYEGEQVAVIPYTIDNLSKAITKLGKSMWNF
jgi:GNAT superfamily N-acetyltransferase